MAKPALPSDDPSPSTSASSANTSGAPTPVGSPFDSIKLIQPSQRKRTRPARLFRTVKSAFRSFPIIATPSCRMPNMPHRSIQSSRQPLIGTLFGHKRGHLSFSVQELPRSTPIVLISLSSATQRFLQDLSNSPILRLALECEKTSQGRHHQSPCRLLEEPTWSAAINGKNIGQATRREPTDADIKVMQYLHATSAGAGVLPSDMNDPSNGELTYMRAHFDRAIGSKDSETFYMTNPEGNGSAELTIFFVRI